MDDKDIIELIHKVSSSRIFTYITIAILFFGIGMVYKASQDFDYFNILLEDMSNHTANHEGYITNGDKVYQVFKVNTNFTFYENSLLDREQCQIRYGIGE